jgi:hypothetical protein
MFLWRVRLYRYPILVNRHAAIFVALLLAQTLYPCNIVMIGGAAPTAIRQLSGTVIGSGRWDLMGHSHDDERRSITVSGARISVKIRTDTAFYRKGEVKYPRGMKHSAGNLKEWKCGGEVSEAKTDQWGNFTFAELKPGKYCLDITGPQPADAKDCGSYNEVSGNIVCNPLHAFFIVDVIPSAPKAVLTADISQQWPDCSGGSSLTLKAIN